MPMNVLNGVLTDCLNVIVAIELYFVSVVTVLNSLRIISYTDVRVLFFVTLLQNHSKLQAYAGLQLSNGHSFFPL